MPRHGGQADDGAALPQVRQRGAGQIERAVEVDGQGGAPLGVGHVGDVLLGVDPGGEHQVVDAAEAVGREGGQRLVAPRRRGVQLLNGDPGARRVEPLLDPVEGVGVPVAEHQVGALLPEDVDDLAGDAACRTGQNQGAVVEVGHGVPSVRVCGGMAAPGRRLGMRGWGEVRRRDACCGMTDA